MNATLGDEEGSVRLDRQGGGVVAGLKRLLKGVGGVVIGVDDGVSILIDELGDLVATQDEDAIVGGGFE